MRFDLFVLILSIKIWCFISRQMGRRWRSLSEHCIPPVGVWEGGFLGKRGKVLSPFPSYYMFTSQVPMDISSSIRHQFNVKIPGGKFVEITFILKGESTWKLWHQSTWIFRRRFDFQNWRNIDDFSTRIFLCRFDVKST